MAIRPDYDIGEVTLVASSANFTTSGSALQTAAVQAGDAIIAPSGHVLIIASITGQNSGTLFLPCPPDAAGTGLPLRIRFQPDGSRYQGAVRVLIDLLSSGNLEAFAALVGAAGLVPIFTGPGTMDLADPATFGIQDPNGSLGKLAALTLENRQILQTDATGALTPVSLTANKTLRTDANADIVLANVEKPLLAAYGGTDVAGLSQIVVDIPDEFIAAEIEFQYLASTAAAGSGGGLSLRCGPSGGALITGAVYETLIFQALGASIVGVEQIGQTSAGLFPVNTAGVNIGKISVSFGSASSRWFCLLSAYCWDNGKIFTNRGWEGPNGANLRRIGIISTAPFVSIPSTSIRIYGVR